MPKSDDKKPRDEWVGATTAGKVDAIEIQVWSDGSGIQFVTPVINAHIQTEYRRAKGPKVLNKTPISEGKLGFQPDDALFENFDLLAAVDTNTRQLRGRPVSVAAIITGVWVPGPDGSAYAIRYEAPVCLEFSPVCPTPERLGWALCLAELRRLGFLKDGSSRFGLIVDSELGKLDRFNARELPIFGDIELPANVTLLYASADSGSEYAANRLLRSADTLASRVLERLGAGRPDPAPVCYFGQPFSSFRRLVGRRPATTPRRPTAST